MWDRRSKDLIRCWDQDMDKKHVCLTNQSESVAHLAQDDLQWTLATGNGQSIASGLSASKQDQGDQTIDNLEVIKPSINHPQVWGWNMLKLGIPWLYHVYTMVIPWLYHGYTMVIPWLYHGYTMVIPWLCHGYAMVMPWLCHGYTMV